MREFMNIVTEDDDTKALRARLRAIAPDRKHLMAMCLNSSNVAALALADGDTKRYQESIDRIIRNIRAAAELDKEADEILAKLNA